MTNLSSLSLNDNQLSGSIPPQIGNLPNLSSLDLQENQLSGNIPPEIGNLSNLGFLILYRNQLSGPIPVELGNLTNMRGFMLHTNQLTGSIPVELGNLIDMSIFNISKNQLSGCYSPALLSTSLDMCKFQNWAISDGNNFDTSWEDFCNSFMGACQTTCNSPDYQGLEALYNSTNGPNWTNSWDLSNCNICSWYGITCHPNGRVKTLSLATNNLVGTIPEDIRFLKEVEVLQFQNNLLQSNLPEGIGNLSSVEYLSIKNNQLIGNIPDGIGNMQNLNFLFLEQNQFSGSIPRTFSNLSNLIQFNVSQNNLSGCFHPTLTQSLCGFTDNMINTGNDFSSSWSDACSCGAGTCPCGDVNQWRGSTGDWDTPYLWSLNHVPKACEHVVIPFSNDVVTMPNNYQSTIYTLEVSGNATLIIPVSSELNVLSETQFVIADDCN